jgi:hypothetical protein
MWLMSITASRPLLGRGAGGAKLETEGAADRREEQPTIAGALKPASPASIVLREIIERGGASCR